MVVEHIESGLLRLDLFLEVGKCLRIRWPASWLRFFKFACVLFAWKIDFSVLPSSSASNNAFITLTTDLALLNLPLSFLFENAIVAFLIVLSGGMGSEAVPDWTVKVLYTLPKANVLCFPFPNLNKAGSCRNRCHGGWLGVMLFLSSLSLARRRAEMCQIWSTQIRESNLFLYLLLSQGNNTEAVDGLF